MTGCLLFHLPSPSGPGMPQCLRAVAATAELVEKASTIILDHPCTIITLHAVLLLLNSSATQHFSAARRTGYEVILLVSPQPDFSASSLT